MRNAVGRLERLYAVPQHAEVRRIRHSIESRLLHGAGDCSRDWVRVLAGKKEHVNRQVEALELVDLRWLVQQS